MSQGQKSQGTKRPKRQNVPKDKTSQGKKNYTSISNFSDFPHFVENGPHTVCQILLFWAGQARLFLGFVMGHSCNEVNLWIGLFLLWRGQARPFLYPGHTGLGNGPHTVCTLYTVQYRMLGNTVNLWIGVRQGHSFILATYWIR